MPTQSQSPLTVAYFTMEVGFSKDIPTFAGGLGVLAADILRSATDLGVKAAGMTMCWQHGYMKQTLNADGTQSYGEMDWSPEGKLMKLPQTVDVTIEGRQVKVGAWMLLLESNGHSVPVYFLDTNLHENQLADRDITKYLYGGDGYMRLKQEAVLGIGGVRMLRALGYKDIGTYHMNEGHAAFLTLELLKEREYKDENVKTSCAFTTHTPVKAGHDVFPYDMAHKVVGDMLPWHIKKIAGEHALSMTSLAMNLSRYTCGVSRVHGMVSRAMFPGKYIDHITNGVHAEHWATDEMRGLFDVYCPGWRQNPVLLAKNAHLLPDADLWKAHMAAKRRLLAEVKKYAETPFDEHCLTIASARRVVAYKRPELLYTNLARLAEVSHGHLQIVHSGNAHPQDPFGQEVIRRMIQRSHELKDKIRIVYLPNYNPDLAKLMVSGADVWLNTPTRLHEASGTSGMKACVNGTLNLSTLDGWWIEGYEMDPQAGWRIGPLAQSLDADDTRQIDAEDLYTQLQYQVIPEYEESDHAGWIHRMKRSIALMGYFNTHRAVKEHVEKAWVVG